MLLMCKLAFDMDINKMCKAVASDDAKDKLSHNSCHLALLPSSLLQEVLPGTSPNYLSNEQSSLMNRLNEQRPEYWLRGGLVKLFGMPSG